MDHYFSYEWLNNDAQYIFQFYVDSKYSGKDQFFDKDVYFYDYYEYNGMPEDRYYCIEYSAEAQKNQSEIIEQSVGMPADLIQKAGNLFFMKYTGITDGWRSIIRSLDCSMPLMYPLCREGEARGPWKWAALSWIICCARSCSLTCRPSAVCLR